MKQFVNSFLKFFVYLTVWVIGVMLLGLMFGETIGAIVGLFFTLKLCEIGFTPSNKKE